MTVATYNRGIRLGATDTMPSVQACAQTSMLDSLQLVPNPRQYPSTIADRIALRLVHTIEKDPTGEILFNASYLTLLPARLKESPALRDCVAFFCHTWTNLQRFQLVEQSPAFISTYGKALRSLTRAMQEPNTRLSAESCAAVTLMLRCNVLFDGGKMAIHSEGIAQIMRRMGPHSNGDQLHKQLAICNNGIVLRHWAAHGGESFYMLDPWKEALGWESPHEHTTASEKDAEGGLARLNYLSGQWPALIMRLKTIRNPHTVDNERLELANRTHHLAAELVSQCDRNYQVCVQNYESGIPMQQALGEDYPAQPALQELPSNHLELLRPLVAYMVLQIVYSRIAFDLSCILGEPNGGMYKIYHQVCRQAWGLLAHLGKIDHPTAVFNYGTPVYLCFEIVEEQADKDYFINTLKATIIRRLLPEDQRSAEKWLMNLCRLMTGRDPIERDIGDRGDLFF